MDDMGMGWDPSKNATFVDASDEFLFNQERHPKIENFWRIPKLGVYSQFWAS